MLERCATNILQAKIGFCGRVDRVIPSLFALSATAPRQSSSTLERIVACAQLRVSCLFVGCLLSFQELSENRFLIPRSIAQQLSNDRLLAAGGRQWGEGAKRLLMTGEAPLGEERVAPSGETPPLPRSAPQP